MLKVPIKIEFLGHLRIQQGERSTTRFRTYKTGVLLAYLAFYGHRAHPREELIEMLWTDCDPVLGRNSLSQSLSSLRHQLEPPGVTTGEVLQADRHNVQINPVAYLTDVSDFEETCRAFQTADREAERSVAFASLSQLYCGEFLPGYYEDWNLRERERLQGVFIQVLLRRIDQLEAQQDIISAIEIARRAIEIDSLNEDTHLRLMRLFVANNNHAHALRQFAELSKTLETELGLPPSADARRLAGQLRAGIVSNVASSSVPKVPKVPKPIQATNFAESPLPSGIVAVLAIEMSKEANGETINRLLLRYGGQKVEVGPNLLAAFFGRASDALDFAIKIQRTFDSEKGVSKLGGLPLLALHAGEIKSGRHATALAAIRFVLNRTLALLKSANAGQFLCTEATAALLLQSLDPNVKLQDLGSYRLSESDKTERIYQAEYEGRTLQEFPALKAEAGFESNLPLQLSRFFGREAEIARLREWLKPNNSEARLVTITGPGGTGKTRLSLETARALQNDYRRSVWFVPLASIKEPRFIPTAILAAMKLPTPAMLDPLAYLISILSRNVSLLVLDNFEHLLSDWSSVSDESTKIVRTLLEQVPTLHCLVTSRRRLGLFGESEFFLEPLPVPFEQDTIEQINLSESVQLFMDRARSVRPSFQITKTSAGVIGEICRCLEGIPLALELAAAQIQVLTSAQILKSLSNRLDFLTDRRRQAEARHQQLRATIDWSFQMLAPGVQNFFAALSIFRGGGNVSDLESVCDEPLALDYLAQLQDFSFLRTEENGNAADMRFRLLETLREFGEEKLSPEALDFLRERHMRHFLNWAENSAPLLKGEMQANWLRRFEQEHQNFLSALDWCLESKDAENGLRLICALSPFWDIRGHVHLGREKLGQILDLSESNSVSPKTHAKAMSSAGDLALAASDFASARDFHDQCLKLYRQQKDVPGQAQALNDLARAAFEQGDYASAGRFIEDSLKLWRKLSDSYGIATSLNTVGLIACEQGRYPEAIASYEESLDLRRKLGDQRGIASQLNNLGIVYRRQGNYQATKTAFAESLAIQRELGNRRSIAGGLSNLSLVTEHEQDYEAARALQEESLTIRREIGDEWGIALSLHILGIISRHQGDNASAQKLLEEGLIIRRRLGNKLGIGQSLCQLGDLFAAGGAAEKAQRHLTDSLVLMSELKNEQGLADVLQACSRLALIQAKPEISAKLFFVAHKLRDTIGAQLPPYEQEELDSQFSELQNMLTPEMLQRIRKQGAKMPLDEAIARALHT